VKLTPIRGAIAALAFAAAIEATAQAPARPIAAGASHASAPDDIATLTIDTRDTGVDLGLARGSDATAHASAARRDSEPPIERRASAVTTTSGIVDAPVSFAPTPPARAATTSRLPPLALGRTDAATAAGAAAQSRAQGGPSRQATGPRATRVGAATEDTVQR